jgi:hypothetical protein
MDGIYTFIFECEDGSNDSLTLRVCATHITWTILPKIYVKLKNGPNFKIIGLPHNQRLYISQYLLTLNLEFKTT